MLCPRDNSNNPCTSTKLSEHNVVNIMLVYCKMSFWFCRIAELQTFILQGMKLAPNKPGQKLVSNGILVIQNISKEDAGKGI